MLERLRSHESGATLAAAKAVADLLKPILDERQREQATAQGPASDSKDAESHNALGESDTHTRSADTADKDNSERQVVAIDVSPTAPQGGGKTDAAAPNRRRRYLCCRYWLGGLHCPGRLYALRVC